jgi:hypothetical protein
MASGTPVTSMGTALQKQLPVNFIDFSLSQRGREQSLVDGEVLDLRDKVSAYRDRHGIIDSRHLSSDQRMPDGVQSDNRPPPGEEAGTSGGKISA